MKISNPILKNRHIFVNLSYGYMHYDMVALDYLVKRAFLVVRFAQYVTHICTTITNRRFSIVYGPKSEKKEATVHINPLLGGFLSEFFFCQDRRSLLAKCCVCGKKSCVGNDATYILLSRLEKLYTSTSSFSFQIVF